MKLPKILNAKRGSGGGDTQIPGLKNAKTRQYLRLAAAGVALYGALYFLFASGEQPKAAPIEEDDISTIHIAAAGEQLDPRESWIGGAGKKVAAQEARLLEQEQNAKAMQDRLARLEEELRKSNLARGAAESPAAESISRSIFKDPLRVAAVAPTPIASPVGFPPGTPGTTAEQIAGAVGFPVQAAAAAPATRPLPPPPVRGIGRVSLLPTSDGSAQGAAAQATGTVAAAVPPEKRASGKTFLPVGMVRAVMLGGLDAPTGGQAQDQPLPVMLRITDLGILPNHFRANVKDCFAVGQAYGDISSERAYIRLVTLSCIRKDGQALEVAVQGHVYDETGKLGVRGQLVSKQGQILANALLAGVVSGIGRGIQYNTSTTTITPFGNAVTQADAGGEFKAGLAEGVGSAMDRLANYYIKLAEQVFPVIEVDAQRAVDLAFTKGIDLDIPLPDLAYGDFHDE